MHPESLTGDILARRVLDAWSSDRDVQRFDAGNRHAALYASRNVAPLRHLTPLTKRAHSRAWLVRRAIARAVTFAALVAMTIAAGWAFVAGWALLAQ